ncbi:predicted protein [Aspergillus terreus NIH2624]|uniref:Uncharacterized protein n=1 Tax=Aspergillus terreus (strain NIH 2624 / FGSC A1156) TaxID=341663 RepID=Q0CZ91_ASPTN|nr:uncharacterized protein ATEG_00993 [Aspergillus terreus NIH2624]EAU37750.1 predicted protein [Aspergillus terreus NIH2624]
MAYTYFHGPADRSNALLVFHDSDASPVYEHPNQGLLCSIIRQNDMAALNSYNACTHTSVFWKAYEFNDSCPFHIAIQNDSFDVLRELCRIYLSDAALTEPLEDYLARFHVSPVIAACATANRGMVSWLMSHDQPLGKLHDHDFEGQTALSRAAEALREAGNVAWEAKPKDRPTAQQRCDRIESFIRWLLECPQAGEQDDSDCVPMPRGTVLGDAVSYAGYDLVSRLIAHGQTAVGNIVLGASVWSTAVSESPASGVCAGSVFSAGVSAGFSAGVSAGFSVALCLAVICALVTPICCCEVMMRASISCRIW